MAIHVGLRDLPAVRRELAAAFDEGTPPFCLQVTSAVFSDNFEGDAEITQLLSQWNM